MEENYAGPPAGQVNALRRGFDQMTLHGLVKRVTENYNTDIISEMGESSA